MDRDWQFVMGNGQLDTLLVRLYSAVVPSLLLGGP